MAKYVIEDTTLTGIADAVRAKTGSTDPIPVTDMAAQIAAMTGGGGSGDSGGAVEGIVYVTFMNGDEELCKTACMKGDSTVDPVEDGKIAVPTKEPTVSTVYTYAGGWALTDGGEADAAALVDVSEDRVVYAVYAGSVRKYTINFYDGETLLNTTQAAYGSTPDYRPVKEGYLFDGWSLTDGGEIEAITVISDMDLYAVFGVGGTLDDISWETISAHSLAGTASANYSVGDSKLITLTNTDGTTENVLAVIAGFGLHRNTDGTKDGITFIIKGLSSAVGSSPTSAPALKVSSAELERYPSDVLAVIRPSQIDHVYCTWSDGKQTVTYEESLFVPEYTNLSGDLKAADGTTSIKVSLWNGSSMATYAATEYLNTQDATQFPLFSGDTPAQIAEFFGLGSGYAMTRTFVYQKTSASETKGFVTVQKNSTYGLCKASGSQQPYPVCFRV